MVKEEKLLTVEDMAKHLRVNVETVRRWIRKRELPAIALGGNTGYRVTQSDFDCFIQAHYRWGEPHSVAEYEQRKLTRQ